MTTEMQMAAPGEGTAIKGTHMSCDLTPKGSAVRGDSSNRPEGLSAGHWEEIGTGSNIAQAVAEARGYRTLYGSDADKEALREIGFKSTQYERDDVYPALLVPSHRATGEVIAHQLKPAIPRVGKKDKPVKYETPAGSSVHVDVPAFTREHLSDLKTALWITEGMKKVDSLVSQGIAAIGIVGVYNWRNRLGTLGDWEDIPVKGRPVVICFDADAKTNRNVQLAMRRLGAWLKSKGASKVHYLIVPGEVNGIPVKGVDDYFAAGGELSGLAAAATESLALDGPKDASFTDAELSERVAEDVLSDRFCYAAGLGWMCWEGKLWKEVIEDKPLEAVKQWARDQYSDALVEQSKDTTRDMRGQINGWCAALSLSKLRAVLTLARGNVLVAMDADQFDSEPDYLNAQNGIVDLKTGDLLPHDPEWKMTKIAGAEYRPGHTHTAWTKALGALPDDARGWYQERIGQSATGHMTPDDLLVIAHGGGSNGKTTINEGIQRALGTYSVLVSDRILLANPDAHPTEFMDLRGARYAVMEETPEARRLDVQRLKRVVGTERITARRIRQDSVVFDATHSLFVNTNFRPDVIETDHGTWRRLALLPFPYTYRKAGEPLNGPFDKHGDPHIRQTIKTDADCAAAVLTWIVEGAVQHYLKDQIMSASPQSVEHATLEWRMESDSVLAFINEFLVFEPNAHIATQDMRDVFSTWLESRGMNKWTEKTFNARFSAHDAVRNRRVEKKNGRSREGLSRRGSGDVFGGSNDSDLPKGTYMRWNGVRFRTDREEAPGVSSVSTTQITPREELSMAVNQSVETLETATGRTPFKVWLSEHSNTMGDRATDITGDPDFPESADHDVCMDYLQDVGCSDDLLGLFFDAWATYTS